MSVIEFEGLIPTHQPVASIYCIGRNYSDHAKELGNPVPVGEPVVFLKTRASLRGVKPEPMGFVGEDFHHEIELVLYIGADFNLGSKLGWESVGAIALGLDLTRRDVQAQLKTKGLPWTTAKSFAGSAVVTSFIPRSEWLGQTKFEFQLTVGGTTRQSGNTNEMIFDVPKLLTYLASFNKLQRGDLVFTGTPAGVGPLRQGDKFTLELKNPHRQWHGIL